MKFRSLLFLSLFFCSSFAQATDELDDLRAVNKNEWRLLKNDQRQKIKIWTKNEDDKPIRSFKVESVIDEPIDSLMRLGADIPAMSRWFFQMKSAKVIKLISAHEVIVYLVFDAPLGVPDRDAIVRITMFPMSSKQPYSLVKWEALPDYLPLKPPFVRMQAANFTAKLTPLNERQTAFDTEGYFNPGGHDPVWAVNFMQTRAPYVSLLGYRRVVANQKYHDPSQPQTFQAE
jgi:hypothetical protein